jgi:calcineurin-like phosphoesterase family protein
MNYYISDLHLGHANIIKYCSRPFVSVEEMNETLIKNWQSVVTEKDTVYIIGDLIFRSGEAPESYLRKLPGKKILVKGNHDDSWLKKPGIANFFEEICDIKVIKDRVNDTSVKLTLSHFPLVEWHSSQHGGICLYGHVHNSMLEPTFSILQSLPNSYNVGADILGFTPQPLSEVIRRSNAFYGRGN